MDLVLLLVKLNRSSVIVLKLPPKNGVRSGQYYCMELSIEAANQEI